MKIFCKTCGVHFPQDFDKTLQVSCNLWGDSNMSNLDKDLKKKIWDWLFLMPADEIYIKTSGLQLVVSFGAKFIAEEKVNWPGIFSNYEEMSEEQKQEAQRAYFNGTVKYLGDKKDGKENKDSSVS